MVAENRSSVPILGFNPVLLLPRWDGTKQGQGLPVFSSVFSPCLHLLLQPLPTPWSVPRGLQGTRLPWGPPGDRSSSELLCEVEP